jgi:FtsZ-binding cell division protein ZapB
MQGRPASQTLLKAFLKALYMDEYITSCEEEFGFLRVTGDLRQKALDAIDALVITAEAPEWTYEFKTASRTGQADYVISAKRQSYSEVEQDNVVDMVALLQLQIDQLKAEKDLLEQTVASLDNHGHATDTHDDSEMNGVDAQFFESDFEQQQETQLMAALALSSISFIFWIVALIFLLVKYALGI